jgi:hypothetical protein
MDVTLVIHLEIAEDPDPSFVWWAESNDLPGFSSAADNLPELLRLSRQAIDEMDLSEVSIRYTLAPPESETRGAFDHPVRGDNDDSALNPQWSASGVAIASRVAA